ncbi:MAG: outer membrane protein assembly factor BamA [Rectinemataceae bacterium]
MKRPIVLLTLVLAAAMMHAQTPAAPAASATDQTTAPAPAASATDQTTAPAPAASATDQTAVPAAPAASTTGQTAAPVPVAPASTTAPTQTATQPAAPAGSAAGTATQDQTSTAEWFWGKPIDGVEWEGVVHADKRELDAVTRNYIGKTFTEDLWMELQSRIYELDWFDKIDPKALPADPGKTKVVIKFTVVEKPYVDVVRVTGNSGLRTNEILDVLTIKSGDIYNQSKAHIDELAVRRLYLEHGYPDATVTSATRPGASPSTVILTFSVVEGSQVAVKEIRFTGNTAVSSATLRGQMSLKQVGFLQSGAFQESKLEDDKAKIVDYYRGRGYVDAAVSDVIRSFEKDPKSHRTWLILTLVIKEGRQWIYGGITFEGNNIYSSTQLGALISQKKGEVINYRKFLLDKQKIDDLYYESGYIFNAIDLQEKRDEATGTIAFVVKITERDRALIENITLKGNKKTKDFVIYREIPLEVGDTFSKAKIMEGIRNLYNLQYFSSVVPQMFPGSAENLMNLEMTVEEQSTADIQFGITLSGLGDPNTFPLSGLLKWSDRDFLGNGQNFSVALNASPDTQTLTFGFNDNWLLGKRISGGVNLSFSHRTLMTAQDTAFPQFADGVPDPYTVPNQWDGSISSIPAAYLMPYEIWSFTIGYSAGYSMSTPVGDLGFGAGLSDGLHDTIYDATKYRPALLSIRQSLNTWRLGNDLTGKVYLNDLDYWYNPGKGVFLSEQLTWAGILPTDYEQYLKSDSKLEAYTTLFNLPVFSFWNFKWVLGLHSGFQALMQKPGAPFTVVDDWVSLDGTFNVRGWNELYGMEGVALWENWLELRMPIVEKFVWLDGFLDAGAVQQQAGMVDVAGTPASSTPFVDTSRPNFGSLGWNDMAFSTGFGLRFTIQQFPFRFYFAWRFTFDGSQITWQNAGPDFVISVTQPLL